MPRITKLSPISSIKVGPGSTVLPNGTIVSPEPYDAVDIYFDDGILVQVERPLTMVKVVAAYQASKLAQATVIDGIATGQPLPP